MLSGEAGIFYYYYSYLYRKTSYQSLFFQGFLNQPQFSFTPSIAFIVAFFLAVPHGMRSAPQPGIESMLPAMESLNHWTAGKSVVSFSFKYE